MLSKALRVQNKTRELLKDGLAIGGDRIGGKGIIEIGGIRRGGFDVVTIKHRNRKRFTKVGRLS